jgi:ankyrin repeat protein
MFNIIVITEDKKQIRQEAESIAKTMNLSVVRLCFQAFLMDEHGRFTIQVDPVISQKVYDSKAPSAGTLKICRLDKTSGSVRGGDDVFLLCDKVQKNDIEVVFYEERHDSSLHPVQPWTAKGRFGPNDVHHQYAIVFQTPAFYNLAIERPVQVNISLRRPSDQETSEPKPFLFLPQEFDEERIGQKRRKKLQHFSSFFSDGGGGAGMGGGFFKGAAGLGDFGGSFQGLFQDGVGGGAQDYSGGGGGGQGRSSLGGIPDIFDMNGPPHSSLGSLGSLGSISIPSLPSFSSNTSSMQHHHHDVGGSLTMHDGGMGSGPGSHPHSGGFQTNGGMDSGQNGYEQQMGVMRAPTQQPPAYMQGYGQQPYMGGGGGYGMQLTPRTGDSVVHVKEEKVDPEYGEVERDSSRQKSPSGAVGGQKSHPGARGGHAGPSHLQPPSHHGKKGMMDLEQEESGFAETLDSGITRDEEGASPNPSSEVETQAAMEAIRERQQSAFQVCERMFSALLAWATTRDVRYLLAAQRSLTAVQNQQGDTALHLAIIHNHQDVVLQLLDVLPQLPPTETPVVDCLNNHRQSPLHLAVLTRQKKVMQYLLKANSNPLVCDRDGNTPLHIACRIGFIEGVATLLGRTNHINAEACRIPELNIRNSQGQTPLHLAAGCGSTDVMKQLVKVKADINVQDSKAGKTALHHSIEKGDLPMTGFLVMETNSNLDCCDFSGNTPLHVAAGQGRSAMVSLLIAAGANVKVENLEGETPVKLAECTSNSEVLRLLTQAEEAGGRSPTRNTDESLSQEMAGVNIKAEGDLSSLDLRSRISLAMLLDIPKDNQDWREVCKRLGMGHLISGFQIMTSPTKELINYFESCDGTVAKLRSVCQEVGRIDAVKVIDRCMEDYRAGQQILGVPGIRRGINTAPVFGQEAVVPHHCLVDSGLGSGNSGSQDLRGQLSTQLPLPQQSSPAGGFFAATTRA